MLWGSGADLLVPRKVALVYAARLVQRPAFLLLRAFVAVTCAWAIVCLCSGQSFADDRPTLAGVWNAAPLTERWNVGDWGSACGPRPSARESPGGQVTVREEGAELVMSGLGRAFRTNECWEQLPNVTRGSHSVSARAWRTRCTSGPNDARQTTLVTNITATDTTMTLDETGEYQFRIEGQNCTASVRRWRNFTISQRQGDAPASVASAAPPAVAPTAVGSTPPKAEPTPLPGTTARPGTASRCAEVGDATRVEVRPTRKLMRPGERFTFRTVALDANGCVVDARTAWALTTAGAKATVNNSGTVVVADDAEDGAMDLSVSFAGKTLHVSVEVATPARYEALLSTASVNDAGESEEAPATIVASGSLGANSAGAQDGSRSRKTTFVIIIGGLAIGLAVLGFVLLRRNSSRREEPTDLEEPPMLAPPPGVAPPPSRPVSVRGLVCPSCRNDFPPHSTFCPHDGNRLVPAPFAPMEPGTSAGGVCPTCGRGYDPGVKTCPVHGDDLVPAAVYQLRAQQPLAAERGKICPSCGGRYGGEATFCGKDGSALVLVN